MTESVSPNGPECAHEIIPLPSGTPIMQRGRASMYKNGETSQGLLVNFKLARTNFKTWNLLGTC